MGGCVAATGQVSFDNVLVGNVTTVTSDSSVFLKLTENIVKVNHTCSVHQIYTVDEANVLGSGMSGNVLSCVHKTTQKRHAMKWLNKSEVSVKDLEHIRDELKCLAHLDHPNILRVHEVFESSEEIHLILELCTGGNLLNRLRSKYGGRFKERYACKYIYSILCAIAYCHAHNVVHRDLKLENIVFENEAEDSEVKVIDFGLSKLINTPAHKMTEMCGTGEYVAPEVLKGKYDARCDVWSIGVIAYALLSGEFPFCSDTQSGVLDAVAQGHFEFNEHMLLNVSAEARDFIRQCLKVYPGMRPTARAALKHPWFKRLQTKAHRPPSAELLRRFAQYVMRTWLAKIFIDAVAHTLSPESVVELREQFKRFDISGTGEISLEDLQSVMSHFQGYNPDHLEPLLNSVDIDQTGQISYHEFLAATIDRTHFTEANLQLAFERISGHQAYITSADIKQLLGANHYNVEEIMFEAGLASEAKIDFEMFKKILSEDEALAPIVEGSEDLP